MENSKQPAFASKIWDGVDGEKQFTGLTKREYFAATAMQGLLANPDYTYDLKRNRDGSALNMNEMCAKESLDMADELLKQLKK